MDGIGALITSSPVTPGGQSVPVGSTARTSHPSSGRVISPARTGMVGTPPTKPVHTSVPPLTEAGRAKRWSLGLGVRRLAIRGPPSTW